MKRDYTDAEFEVVSEGRKTPEKRSWNGIGIPPQWSEWGPVEKIAYAIIYPALIVGFLLFQHWLFVHL